MAPITSLAAGAPKRVDGLHNAGPSSLSPLLEAEHLSVVYGGSGPLRGRRAKIRAVNDASFEIGRGETLGLVGESGCGKSTLGRAIIRLTQPSAGRVTFDGMDLAKAAGRSLRSARRRMQIVFQDPYASLNPRMTVGALVAEPLRVHHLGTRREVQARVSEILELVGLDPAYDKRYPHEFSGGQRQRVAIARALAVGPEFVVCDEPVSSLDVAIQAQILNLLNELRQQLGLTMLFIAHDLAVIRHVSDRVAVMYLGRIVEVGDVDRLFATPAHPYTKSLLSAVPVPDPEVERTRRPILLEGDLPSPAHPPTGCSFHTRCWLYSQLGQPETCRSNTPDLQEVATGQRAACHFTDIAQTSDGAVPRDCVN
jgi:oligopeptide transport system ATP-binding protein